MSLMSSMENQLHKGIRQHVVHYFEGANVAGLEDMCKKLQASVDDLGLKVAILSQTNGNQVMEIDSVSESFTEPRKPTFTPPCFAIDIIDELSDRDKRKKNIIVCNLPESKSDNDAFADLCSSVYSYSFAIARSVRLGKKTPGKNRLLLLSLHKEEDIQV